jgi:hypothetical protein
MTPDATAAETPGVAAETPGVAAETPGVAAETPGVVGVAPALLQPVAMIRETAAATNNRPLVLPEDVTKHLPL